ncbi:hypothetical protein [Peptostreptococcus stomatis]|uniref:hypothetical protein n=1 Tax=Peptostreptococcus stomatis TaxID=341694 RepID=UPI0026F07D9A|nr:hypothetical protein [Peptostreptococcus stomatis]
MNENKYYKEFIKKLDNITEDNNITDDKINNQDLLYIFCEFISSNPYFKYNGTYLRDSIVLFDEKISGFLEKKKIIKSFIDEISKKYESLYGWHLIIDNYYVITQDLKIKLLLDFNINDYINKYINEFNFSQYDTDFFLIRYLKISIDEYTKTTFIEREVLEKQKIKDIQEDNYNKIVNRILISLERLIKE